MGKLNSKEGPAPTVKKVMPYPFAALLDPDGKKINVQVRKITMQGFIANLPQGFVKVGDEYLTRMELPVHSTWVNGKVKVMKTYDQFKEDGNPASRVDRFAEFRFIEISEDHKANINRFMTAIRQA